MVDASLKQNSIDLSYQVAFNLYALDAQGQRTQSLIDNFHMTKEIEVSVMGGKSTRRKIVKRQYEYDYELGSASMERPWLLPESRSIQGDITLTVVAHTGGGRDKQQTLSEKNLYNLMVQDFSHSVLHGSLIELEYQRELFSFMRALCQLVVSAFTLLYLLDYIRRLKEYHRVLYHDSVLPLFALSRATESSPGSAKSEENCIAEEDEDEDRDEDEEGVRDDESISDEANKEGHFQYESLHSGEEGGRRSHSPFFSHAGRSSSRSFSSHDSGASKEDDGYDTSLVKNIENSPVNRFSFLSFLLAEQVCTRGFDELIIFVILAARRKWKCSCYNMFVYLFYLLTF